MSDYAPFILDPQTKKEKGERMNEKYKEIENKLKNLIKKHSLKELKQDYYGISQYYIDKNRKIWEFDREGNFFMLSPGEVLGHLKKLNGLN